MKEESMNTFGEGVKQIAGALYDAGFADGKAEQAALPVGEGLFTQEQVDAKIVEAKKAGYDEAVAADTTPISQEKYDALEVLFKGANATIEGVKAALNLVPAPVVEIPIAQ
jgi:hypothetical protein